MPSEVRPGLHHLNARWELIYKEDGVRRRALIRESTAIEHRPRGHGGPLTDADAVRVAIDMGVDPYEIVSLNDFTRGR